MILFYFSEGWSKRFYKITQVIALMTTITFVVPYISWAFEPSSLRPGQVKFNNQVVEIPRALGAIVASYQGKNRLVVYIQDLHCNYEVQSNISRILDYLANQHGFKLVGVEGAGTTLDISKLSTFPVASVKKRVCDFLLHQGKITGMENYAATGQQPVVLEGLEDIGLYQENYQTILKFLNNENQGLLLDLRETLNEVKPSVYNQALQTLDRQKTKFHEGRLTLAAYGTWLAAYARRKPSQLASYTCLAQYLASQKTCLGQEVDSDQLLQDLENLDLQLRTNAYTRADQQELDQLEHRLDLMEKLLNISVTPEELAEFRTHPEWFEINIFREFINRYDNKLGENLGSESYGLDASLEQVKAFYTVADQRSTALIVNLEKCMVKHRTDMAVVVTGGYHAQEIQAELARRGWSYLCVKPTLRRQDVVNPYFSLLMGRKTPLEKLLGQNQNIFQIPRPFAEPGAKQVAPAVHLLANEVDQLDKASMAVQVFDEGETNDEVLQAKCNEVFGGWSKNNPAIQLSEVETNPASHIMVGYFNTGVAVVSAPVKFPVLEPAYCLADLGEAAGTMAGLFPTQVVQANESRIFAQGKPMNFFSRIAGMIYASVLDPGARWVQNAFSSMLLDSSASRGWQVVPRSFLLWALPFILVAGLFSGMPTEAGGSSLALGAKAPAYQSQALADSQQQEQADRLQTEQALQSDDPVIALLAAQKYLDERKTLPRTFFTKWQSQLPGKIDKKNWNLFQLQMLKLILARKIPVDTHFLYSFNFPWALWSENLKTKTALCNSGLIEVISEIADQNHLDFTISHLWLFTLFELESKGIQTTLRSKIEARPDLVLEGWRVNDLATLLERTQPEALEKEAQKIKVYNSQKHLDVQKYLKSFYADLLLKKMRDYWGGEDSLPPGIRSIKIELLDFLQDYIGRLEHSSLFAQMVFARFAAGLGLNEGAVTESDFQSLSGIEKHRVLSHIVTGKPIGKDLLENLLASDNPAIALQAARACATHGWPIPPSYFEKWNEKLSLSIARDSGESLGRGSSINFGMHPFFIEALLNFIADTNTPVTPDFLASFDPQGNYILQLMNLSRKQQVPFQNADAILAACLEVVQGWSLSVPALVETSGLMASNALINPGSLSDMMRNQPQLIFPELNSMDLYQLAVSSTREKLEEGLLGQKLANQNRSLIPYLEDLYAYALTQRLLTSYASTNEKPPENLSQMELPLLRLLRQHAEQLKALSPNEQLQIARRVLDVFVHELSSQEQEILIGPGKRVVVVATNPGYGAQWARSVTGFFHAEVKTFGTEETTVDQYYQQIAELAAGNQPVILWHVGHGGSDGFVMPSSKMTEFKKTAEALADGAQLHVKHGTPGELPVVDLSHMQIVFDGCEQYDDVMKILNELDRLALERNVKIIPPLMIGGSEAGRPNTALLSQTVKRITWAENRFQKPLKILLGQPLRIGDFLKIDKNLNELRIEQPALFVPPRDSSKLREIFGQPVDAKLPGFLEISQALPTSGHDKTATLGSRFRGIQLASLLNERLIALDVDKTHPVAYQLYLALAVGFVERFLSFPVIGKWITGALLCAVYHAFTYGLETRPTVGFHDFLLPTPQERVGKTYQLVLFAATVLALLSTIAGWINLVPWAMVVLIVAIPLLLEWARRSSLTFAMGHQNRTMEQRASLRWFSAILTILLLAPAIIALAATVNPITGLMTLLCTYAGTGILHNIHDTLASQRVSEQEIATSASLKPEARVENQGTIAVPDPNVPVLFQPDISVHLPGWQRFWNMMLQGLRVWRQGGQAIVDEVSLNQDAELKLKALASLATIKAELQEYFTHPQLVRFEMLSPWKHGLFLWMKGLLFGHAVVKSEQITFYLPRYLCRAFSDRTPAAARQRDSAMKFFQQMTWIAGRQAAIWLVKQAGKENDVLFLENERWPWAVRMLPWILEWSTWPVAGLAQRFAGRVVHNHPISSWYQLFATLPDAVRSDETWQELAALNLNSDVQLARAFRQYIHKPSATTQADLAAILLDSIEAGQAKRTGDPQELAVKNAMDWLAFTEICRGLGMPLSEMVAVLDINHPAYGSITDAWPGRIIAFPRALLEGNHARHGKIGRILELLRSGPFKVYPQPSHHFRKPFLARYDSMV